MKQKLSSKIIFLGGIHVTGKGVLGKKLCSNLELNYLSASELIKWNEISQDVNNKAVDDISHTQQILINAIEKTCKEGENYLLDGHYCLLNSNQQPTKVDYEVFNKISPSILLIITEEPSLIIERLKNRDGKDYSLNLITEMQVLEEKYAQEIADKLKIPLYNVSNSNVEEISFFLKDNL